MTKKSLQPLIPMVSILAALLAGGTVIAATGENPVAVFQKMIRSTLGSGYGIGQIVFRATTLLLTGLAVALPFKVKLFNIGAEGQLLMGSFAAALFGAAIPPETHPALAVPLALLCAMAAGSLWGLLAGWLKTRHGVNEVISSIMLNFIALAITGYLLTYHFALPSTVRTPTIQPAARIPGLDALSAFFRHSPANMTTFLALTLSGAAALLLYRSRFGYEMRASGLTPDASRYAGINTNAHILAAMAIGGAIAGLGAGNIVLGYRHCYEAGLTAGAGFMGIAVALLANAHPVWLVFSALLFGWLDYGGLTVNTIVPKDIFMMIQGMTILCIISFNALLRNRLGT